MTTGPWRHYVPGGAVLGAAPGARISRAARLRFLVAELRAGQRAILRFAGVRFCADYHAQALGRLWPVANPLVLTIVVSVVFGVVFRTRIEHYPVFLMLGLIVWHFLTHAITDATVCMLRHAELVKRTAVPRHIIPVGTVLAHVTSLGLASLSLVPLVAIYPGAFRVTPALAALPVLIALVILLAMGIVLATSVLNVLYRDVNYLVDSLLIVLFWATPIVWPLDSVSAHLRPILLLNPLAAILQGIRDVVLKGAFPAPRTLLAGTLGVLAIVVTGAVVYVRHHADLADRL